MLVKELKKYLDTLEDNSNLYVEWHEASECFGKILTEEEVIYEANELTDDEDTSEEKFSDIDNALCYLADMNPDYHYIELTL